VGAWLAGEAAAAGDAAAEAREGDGSADHFAEKQAASCPGARPVVGWVWCGHSGTSSRLGGPGTRRREGRRAVRGVAGFSRFEKYIRVGVPWARAGLGGVPRVWCGIAPWRVA
jgi:hypothetical protein